jgi:hypothetical protein
MFLANRLRHTPNQYNCAERPLTVAKNEPNMSHNTKVGGPNPPPATKKDSQGLRTRSG